MKLKYRKVAHVIAVTPVAIMTTPFWLLTMVCGTICDLAVDYSQWLYGKLKLNEPS